MKLFQTLPAGSVSALTKAAKNQRAAELSAKMEREIKERAVAYEASMLQCIDDEVKAGRQQKALALIDIYLKRYPKSGVLAQVSEVREGLIDFLAERQARKHVSRMSHQGVPFVESLPASWGRS